VRHGCDGATVRLCSRNQADSLAFELALQLNKGLVDSERKTTMTTTTMTTRPSTRLDDIAQRALRGRKRQWLFIAAVALISLIAAGTIAFAGTGAL
jgi:hypothetical protein